MTEDEAKFYEKMYVEYYQSYQRSYGYNQTKGGEDRSNLAKPVAQYTIEGVFIRTYINAEYAARINGWKRVVVSIECSHGYQWKYIDDYSILPSRIPPIKIHKWATEIEKYDLLGNYITSYESIIEATKQNGITFLNLRRDRTVISYGAQYKRAIDNFIVDNVFDRKSINIPVYCYSLQGEFICKYNNRKEALRKLGIFDGMKASTYEDYNMPFFIFYNVYNNAYKGYRWTYVYYEKLPPLIEVHYLDHPVIQLDNDFNLIDIYPHATCASASINKSYKKSHNNMIRNACRKNEQYRNQSSNKPCKAYHYVWFRFIDIARSEIKISDLFLLKKYYIYVQILEDLERRNAKKCHK